MATEFDPDEVVRSVTDSLGKKFPHHDVADIESRVRRQVNNLKDHPITDYVGVLAEREVKKELKSAG